MVETENQVAAHLQSHLEQLPAADLGCLYLDAGQNPTTPDPTGPTFSNLTRHFGCVRSAWPRIS